jgi:predicted short-subunit dehydrogenase-like oxidoreductase (DUF2520 family)
MVKVIVIGSGNVAQHLVSAFLQSSRIELVQVYARNESAWEWVDAKVRVIHNLGQLEKADLYIISVSDDAIADVSQQLPFDDRLVVHTSGSVSIDGLSHRRRGVFYPLQTFSKNKPVDFNTIPICLETNPDDFALLEKVARSISGHIYKIDSGQRKALHVAAVFANNFTNHLYKIGADICAQNQIPFDILKPLIRETAEKVMTLAPADAQTGPAKRNDVTTIQKHLEFLFDENQKKIYQLLTQSIQHGQKL